jgi:hypothetical protein
MPAIGGRGIRGVAATSAVCLLVVTVLLNASAPTSIMYDPRQPGPHRLLHAADPAAVVAAFLGATERLPPAGTALLTSEPRLAWVAVPGTAVPITRVEVRQVRIVGQGTALHQLIDDDPILYAAVDALVTTDDGRQSRLTFEFWDYGRATPWSVYSVGDGWKPASVRWDGKP